MISQIKISGSYLGHGAGGQFPNANVEVQDSSYARVLDTWFLEDFYNWWRAELSNEGILKWNDFWDCDDFAGDLCRQARRSYAKTTLKLLRQGKIDLNNWAEAPAIGRISYDIDGGKGYHAIVVAYLVDKKGNKKDVYIEPQETWGKIKILTPYEIEGQYRVWF